MKLKNWIRRSFRNRVFATILVVTLVPLLLLPPHPVRIRHSSIVMASMPLIILEQCL